MRPAVTRGGGATAMAALWALACTLGVAFLAIFPLTGAGSALLGLAGIGEPVQATVTTKAFVDRTPVGRGSSCDFYRFEVAWEDRTGSFTVCENQPLTTLDAGEQVEVWTVPWSGQVAPDEPATSFWGLLGLAAGGWLAIQGFVSVVRYLRLRRPGTGQSFEGRTRSARRTLVRIEPGPEEPDDRSWSLVSAGRDARLAVADPVTIWSSRRGWTGRPRGPWAVECRGQVTAFTHAWRHRP